VFGNYGDLLLMNNPVSLTDAEAEYVVSVTKYHFEDFIILEFKIKNNMQNIVKLF
jgi:hypothetical protein